MLSAVLPSRSATSLAVSPPGELCKISRTRSVRTGSIDCPRNGPHLRTINEPASWRKRERYRRHRFQWDVADVQQPQSPHRAFLLVHHENLGRQIKCVSAARRDNIDQVRLPEPPVFHSPSGRTSRLTPVVR